MLIGIFCNTLLLHDFKILNDSFYMNKLIAYFPGIWTTNSNFCPSKSFDFNFKWVWSSWCNKFWQQFLQGVSFTIHKDDKITMTMFFFFRPVPVPAQWSKLLGESYIDHSTVV